MINGKLKGSAFERKISVQLSNWWSDNSDKNVFWRTPSSGARFTQLSKTGDTAENQSGDIMYISADGKPLIDKFYIELKSLSDINIWSFITKLKGKSTISSITVDTFQKAEAENKIPIIIAKQNYKPIIVISNTNLVEELSKIKPNYNIPSEYYSISIRYTADLTINIFLFDELFNGKN